MCVNLIIPLQSLFHNKYTSENRRLNWVCPSSKQNKLNIRLCHFLKAGELKGFTNMAPGWAYIPGRFSMNESRPFSLHYKSTS